MFYIIPKLHQITTTSACFCACKKFYIIPKLHQITTFATSKYQQICFISFQNYIKSQLILIPLLNEMRFISFQNYIKSQPFYCKLPFFLRFISFQNYIKSQPSNLTGFCVGVLYHSKITSNHNA